MQDLCVVALMLNCKVSWDIKKGFQIQLMKNLENSSYNGIIKEVKNSYGYTPKHHVSVSITCHVYLSIEYSLTTMSHEVDVLSTES